MPASQKSPKTTTALTSKLALVSLATDIALAGCSQQQKRPARNSSDHQGRKKPADNDRTERREKIAAAAKAMLDSTLEEVQFCPQGYKVLDSIFNRDRYIIQAN